MNHNTRLLHDALDELEARPEAFRLSCGWIAATLRMIPALPSDASDTDIEERDSAAYRRDSILWQRFGIPT
jgi:hypothetical protein